MTTVWVGVLLLAQANSPMLNMEPEGLDRAPERIEADQETDPVKYRQKAKALYDRAERLLGNDLGIEAAQTFRMVMEKYPFSRFAVLAELGHAKALAAQGEAEGSLSGFTRFLKQHPGHPKSGDVRFAIIQTSWAERPGTFALLPPAHERDLEDARATVIAANAFLEFHRDDARSAEVRRIRSAARTLLYRQQVFLARWSAEQGRPHAALARWRTARQEYADVPETATDKDWVDGVEKQVKASPLVYPEPPKLYPEQSVLSEEAKP